MDAKLDALFEFYLKSNKKGHELEAKFGTKNSITRINFDNVISRLKSLGFNCEHVDGNYRLNIQNEYFDNKTGRQRMSNVRTEINGLKNIQMYCKKNLFDLANPPEYITFRQKKPIYIEQERVLPMDYRDFGFRVNFKEEKILFPKYKIIQELLEKWSKSKKTFRFIKRFTFTHEKYPLKIDCSIVKTSKRSTRNKYIPTYLIQETDLFKRPEEYEIEIEILPKSQIQIKKSELIQKFKLTWRYVLSGIQETNYPISYSETGQVLKSYMKIVSDESSKKKKRGKKEKVKKITTRDFIGPSPVSLQFINIQEPRPDVRAPNIRKGYTVTEKADGIRKLLLFGDKSLNGKVFLIDMNMNVQFTGCVNQNANIYNTIIDGEHVLYDKKGKFINKFLSFDLYYKSGKDMRHYPFINGGSKVTYAKGADINQDVFRLRELHNLISKKMKLKNIVGDSNTFSITGKTFIFSEPSASIQYNIFASCNTILQREKDGFYEYEIDGLIFTPENTGINSSIAGERIKSQKKRWDAAFKWKPSKFNTVDFLVSTKKMENGADFIGNLFRGGKSLQEEEQILQYKTLILRVGYKPSYGFLNPCQSIISGNIPKKSSSYDNKDYKPELFFPTNPYDNNAHLTNVILDNNKIGTKYMFTENKEDAFEDNMIVEFRYDENAKVGWRWKPIRVRYDKTEDLRRTGKNFGNDYLTAQGVWQAIHNPITDFMIQTGEHIPDIETNDDVYYNIKSNKSDLTRPLRDFHNYVKRKLIVATSKHGETLIDMAVGKAGDLHKWIHAHLSFVFGIDISRDNIENRKDGACTRYIKEKWKFHNIPDVLFIVGNSSLNIRDGTYCMTENCKKITNAIFGKGKRSEKALGTGVYKQFGVGKDGFNIVSCQFAIHYFFKNKLTLHGFLRNVCETCKVGGYFIGTCLDGNMIFDLLEDKEKNDNYIIQKEGETMWEALKIYETDTFEPDETSIGLTIGIFQESIGQMVEEYLVNFEYLRQSLEKYGFHIVPTEKAVEFGLPNSTGNFNDLFHQMCQEIETGGLKKSKIKKASDMTEEEKQLSFMNRYFIFEKRLEVNASEVYLAATGQSKKTLEKVDSVEIVLKEDLDSKKSD